MKRRLLWLIALIVVVLSAIAVHNVHSARSKKRRAAEYKSALLMYSQNLAPGVTRKDVETYLRASSTRFVQRWGGEEKRPVENLNFTITSDTYFVAVVQSSEVSGVRIQDGLFASAPLDHLEYKDPKG